ECVERSRAADRVWCSLSPCGGNPVGTWTASRLCVPTRERQACAAGRLLPTDVAISGELSLVPDGTFTVNVVVGGTYEGVIPGYCASDLGCSGAAALLTPRSAPEVTCRANAEGGCACSSPIMPPWLAHGRYTTSQNVLTLLTETRAATGELVVR